MARCLGGSNEEGAVKRGPPIGIKIIREVYKSDGDLYTYQIAALAMTFVAYSLYHASRKPLSIVKSVLDYEDSNVTSVDRSLVALYQQMPMNYLASRQNPYRTLQGYANSSLNGSAFSAGRGWAPFNQKYGKGLLGDVDLAFLASYAVGMYFAGQLGDRLDLRKFLSAGMIGSGFFVCLFGAGYFLNIHYLSYFIIVQIFSGFVQSTGWPSVVSIVGKWFGRSKRGLIMGIWNAHTSVGNIVGSLLAAGALQYGWGWSFILPGALQAMGGILMFFFLVVEPADVGLHIPQEIDEVSEVPRQTLLNASVERQGDLEVGATAEVASGNDSSSLQDRSTARTNLSDLGERDGANEEARLLASHGGEMPHSRRNDAAVGFAEAWRIPGVAQFALCLFFAKLVAYTFLNWLPFYISQTKIAGEYLDDKTSGNLSTMFDVGGVVGGILAGHLSDKMNARATTAAGFMYAAIPALYLYRNYGSYSLYTNIVLMMVAGVLVNGPYALITTAVSADLGTHSSLNGNPRALATVTAIIDGTGSVGAAVGPLITGYVAEYSWDWVFWFLMVSALVAGLLLSNLLIAEVTQKLHNHPTLSKQLRHDEISSGSLKQYLISGKQ